MYQFRHHDVTSTAHLVFLVIALALIFEVVGIFTSSVFFWVLFIFFYISFVLVFIIQVISSSLFIQTTKSYNIFKMSDISQLVWTWHQNQNYPSDAECEIIGPMWWRKCNQRLFPSCSLFWICPCLSGKYIAILYFKSVHKSIVSGEYCNGFLVLLQEESRCFTLHLGNNDGQHGALYIQLHLLQTLLQVGDIYMIPARVSLLSKLKYYILGCVKRTGFPKKESDG